VDKLGTMAQTTLGSLRHRLLAAIYYKAAHKVVCKHLAYTGSGVTAKIEAVGGGWHRCSITFDQTNTQVRFYTTDNANANAAGTIYIQDAQLNYGLVAQEYQETTTTSVVSGITNDMPRLDYSGGASCPSLLLEPQRTNLVTSTEYLEYGWSLQNGATISFESVTAPDGSNLVTKVQANSDDAGRNQDSLGTLGTNHIWSGFFKGTGVATRLRFRNNQGEQVQYNIDASGNFTLHDADSANHGIEDFPNGWYRIWFETTTSGASTNYVQIYPDVENGTGSVYAWGIQAEEGSYVTSYIPNYGLTSGATRLADACSKTGISSLIGQTEGTLFAEFVHNGADILTTQSVISVNSGNTTNFVNIGVYDGRLNPAARGSGTNIFDLFVGPNPLPAGTHKIALAYKSNDFAIYLNGSSVYTSTSAATFSLSQLDLGTFLNLNTQLGDGIKQALLFKTRLSNADLATLTA
jgi:hypothetical protein